MPATFVSGGTLNFTFGSFRQATIGGRLANDGGTLARTARIAGTFSKLGLAVSATGTGRVITMRKGPSGPSNQTLTVSPVDSTAQVVYDLVHQDHYAVADTWEIQTVNTTGAPLWYVAKIVFTADSGHASYYSSGLSSPGTTTTVFYGISGANNTTTEASMQCLMRTAGTLQNCCIFVQTASTTAATVVSRIGGVTKTITVSITANITGAFEDPTHSDAFVSGNLLNWQLSGHSASVNMAIGSAIAYSATSSEVFTHGDGQNLAFNASNQFFGYGAGGLVTTEALVQVKHDFSVTSSNLRMNISGSSAAGTRTFNLRKNGANGNQLLTVVGSATGQVEDGAHSDSFRASDVVNFMMSGGTSGAIIADIIMNTELFVPETVVKNPQLLYIPRRR